MSLLTPRHSFTDGGIVPPHAASCFYQPKPVLIAGTCVSKSLVLPAFIMACCTNPLIRGAPRVPSTSRRHGEGWSRVRSGAAESLLLPQPRAATLGGARWVAGRKSRRDFRSTSSRPSSLLISSLRSSPSSSRRRLFAWWRFRVADRAPYDSDAPAVGAGRGRPVSGARGAVESWAACSLGGPLTGGRVRGALWTLCD